METEPKKQPELVVDGVSQGCNGCCYITDVKKDNVIKCTKPNQNCKGIIFTK